MTHLKLQWIVLFAVCGNLYPTKCQQCDEYVVSPTCHEEPCLTLLEIASLITQSNGSLHSCIHLSLLPGEHILTQPLLFFEGIKSFTVGVKVSDTNTSLACTNTDNSTSLRLEFNNVTEIYIHGVTLRGCEIFTTNVELFTVKKCIFDGENTGGIAFSLVNTRIEISHCILSHLQGLTFGPYAHSGGAIICRASTITMTDCMINNNRAKYGGAIFADSSCNIIAWNTTFVDNHSNRGGVLTSLVRHSVLGRNSEGEIVVRNCSFSGNSAHRGGVLSTEYQNVDIQNSIFSDNHGFYGGVFYLNESIIYIKSSLFTNCSAEWGGVFFAYHARVHISNHSNFTGGNAYSSGGVMYATSGTNVDIDDSYFVSNVVQVNGGVISISRGTNIAIYNSFFKNNKAGKSGGVSSAYYSQALRIHGSRFLSNTARDGGVLYFVRPLNATAYINNSQFTNNAAQRYGGIYYAYSNMLASVNNCYFEADENKSIFSNSKFSNNSAYRGGVLFTHFQSTGIENSIFLDNRGFFGGVFDLNNSLICIKLSEFINSSAEWGGVFFAYHTIVNSTKHGGVLNLRNSAMVSINSSQFTNNTAQSYGGVYFEYSQVHPNNKNNGCFDGNSADEDNLIMFSNSKFSKNSALRGGVLFLRHQIVDIQSSIFSENYGLYGGVFYLNQSIIDIKSSEFINNSAEWGGVLFVYHASVHISNHSNFTGGNAYSSGGVIYATIGANVNINNSYFESNVAQFDGGVLSTYQGARIVIHYSIFENNRAGNFGGVSFGYRNQAMFIYCSEFHSNTALHGGVLYLLCNATADIIDSQFTDNTAQEYGGVYCASTFVHTYINNSYFDSNSADLNGGAISSALNQFMYIQNSHFINNECKQAGGVLTSEFNATTFIHSSEFSYNKAKTGGTVRGLHADINFNNCSFANNFALYTGGTISLLYTTTEIHNSFFEQNIAHYAGGAISAYYNQNNFIKIYKSHFTNNTAYGHGGAIHCVYNTSTDIYDSTFTHNSALRGGAIYVFDYVYKSIYEKNQFMKFNGITILNSNHAVDVGGAIVAAETTIHVIDQLVVANNSAELYGGGIFLHESRMEVRGKCMITGNQANRIGGGIDTIGSSILLGSAVFGSSVTFISNVAGLGGGISLSLNSRLYILIQASAVHTFNFIENTAAYGGAVYVEDETYYETCTGDVYSSIPTSSRACIFQVIGSYRNDSANVKILKRSFNFTNNHARFLGEQLYGGLLDRCTANSSLESDDTSVNAGIMLLSQISNINFNNLSSKSISSNPSKVYFCINSEPNVSYNSPVIKVKQGKSFNVSVVAVDQVNNPRRAFIKASLSSMFTGLSEGQHSQLVNATCTNLTFTVTAPDHIKEEKIVLHPDGPGVCGDGKQFSREIRIQFKECSCPVGFQRNDFWSNDCVCTCHRNITRLVMNCNPTTLSFTRKQNSWISYVNTSYNAGNFSRYYLLFHEHCPYDYCSQLPLKGEDGINKHCSQNRAGVLCGKCQHGFSVSIGSSKCIKCTNSWPALLLLITILALLAGFGLVYVILFLNLTVAVGTINGIIFYAHIIVANKSVLVRLSSTSFPSIFISWINLDIGIDACFYDGMDTYTKTWLQMALPAYLIILIVAVIISSKYSEKFSRLIGRKNPVATLATLILLSYAKLLSTIVNVMSNTELMYPDGPHTFWLPDANITFLKDSRHIFLFFVGILIIAIGTAYTLMLFSWQWLLQLPDWKIFRWTRFPRLNSFIETYHAPYSCNYRYWTGLLLLVRVILYLISALNTSGDPKVPLLATILAIGILILFDKDRCRNSVVGLMESSIYLNILILAAFSWYTIDSPSSDNLHTAAIYISTLTVFAQLVLVVVYHSYQFTKLHNLSTKVYKYLPKSRLRKELPKKKYDSQISVNIHINQDIDMLKTIDGSVVDYT